MRLLLTKSGDEKSTRIVSAFSMGLHIVIVMFLALAGESYAAVLAFMMLIVKVLLLFKYMK